MVSEVFLEIFFERESEPRSGEERQKNLSSEKFQDKKFKKNLWDQGNY